MKKNTAPSRTVVAGTVACLLSAVAYTVANICLRQLAALDTEPAWAMCGKDIVAVLVLGPWLLLRRLQGRPVFPSRHVLLLFVLIGIATQFGGNLLVQWSYGVVGLAVTTPAVMGSVLISGALVARVRLGEPITHYSLGAIVLLLTATVLLSVGAEKARFAMAPAATLSSAPILGAAGTLAACFAGVMFGATSATIREAVSGTTRPTAIAMIICLVGVVGLGALSSYRLGWSGLSETTPQQFAWITAAGVMNLLAFLALIMGLQWATVLRANVLNASQVAMAAMAGILFFGEPPSAWLVVGVSLTIAGTVLMDRPLSP